MKAESDPFADAPLALQMLEISPAAVAVIDRDGRISYANARLTELLGYSEEELLGESLESILRGAKLCDLLTRSALPMTHSLVEQDSSELRVVAIRKSGSVVPITVSLHEVDRGHDSLLLAHFVRSDQKTIEHDLVESERLAAIAQMVSGLAHESRNALQRAIACLDLLELDLKSNPDQMQLSQRIRESLSIIFENYDEVRRYAQPICINSQQVSLFQLCRAIFDESTIHSGQAKHRLDIFQSCNREDTIEADADKIKLVMQHLLSNAIDATHEPAWIEAHCQGIRWQESDAVRFSFRDHGRGFDEASLQNAFQPFYTTKQRGTGLGLAICRRIIEAHRGMISAANHPGGGAVIEMLMPIRSARSKKSERSARSDKPVN